MIHLQYIYHHLVYFLKGFSMAIILTLPVAVLFAYFCDRLFWVMHGKTLKWIVIFNLMKTLRGKK